MTMTIRRPLLAAAAAGLLSACASGNDLDERPEPLGDFRLGHNVVVVNDPKTLVVSRKVDPELIQKVVEREIERRFRRYEGDRLYHFGVTVDAYTLAPPGVPFVFTMKSIMILRITVWDDAAGRKLNEEPHQIVVIEPPARKSFILGSGLTMSKEEQLDRLARSAAKQIEVWLSRQHRLEGWFGDPEADAAAAGAAGEGASGPAGSGSGGEAEAVPETVPET